MNYFIYLNNSPQSISVQTIIDKFNLGLFLGAKWYFNNCSKHAPRSSNLFPVQEGLMQKLYCIRKLFECAIYDSLYIQCKFLISPQKRGFLKTKSTVTNLTEFVSYTLKLKHSEIW